MLTITNAPGDQLLATRLKQDLQQAGYTVGEWTPGREHLVIAVLSPEGVSDAGVQQTIIAALDGGQHIIPTLAKKVELPKLIDHLQPLDLSAGYEFEAVRERVEALSSADASKPLKVLTPAVKRSNRRVGYVLAAAAILWFLIGVVLVGVYGVQAPPEEYAAVETEIVLTRDYYLEQNRPRTTEDAANFPATLEVAPTAQYPFLLATATAQAGQP